jgi:hypothetical protein
MTQTERIFYSVLLFIVISCAGGMYWNSREEAGDRGHAVVGTVITTQRNVRGRRDDSFVWGRLDGSDKVFGRDTIFVGEGSQAKIDLRDGTKLELMENSLVVLQDAQVRLIHGDVRVDASQSTGGVRIDADGNHGFVLGKGGVGAFGKDGDRIKGQAKGADLSWSADGKLSTLGNGVNVDARLNGSGPNASSLTGDISEKRLSANNAHTISDGALADPLSQLPRLISSVGSMDEAAAAEMPVAKEPPPPPPAKEEAKAEPQPAPEVAPKTYKPYACVKKEGGKFHEKATSKSPVAGDAQKGYCAKVLDRFPEQPTGPYWAKLRYEKDVAWIQSKFLKEVDKVGRKPASKKAAAAKPSAPPAQEEPVGPPPSSPEDEGPDFEPTYRNYFQNR